jgi:citrate synthase
MQKRKLRRPMPTEPPISNMDSVRSWWRTDLIDIEPGSIRIRGFSIEDLIGKASFTSMIWLMLRGELPNAQHAALFDAVLVSAVDHGPQAPSIATARMAITCGVGLNNAVASGVNALGDVHGGAGTQCMTLLTTVEAATDRPTAIEAWRQEYGKHVPGYGHRIHPVDPRTQRLSALLRDAADAEIVSGSYLETGLAIEDHLGGGRVRRLPMNIDGITAVALLELGFPPDLGRGVFVLSRAVGICAHAWEQSQQGGRIKGPLPPELGYAYSGPAPRDLPEKFVRENEVDR